MQIDIGKESLIANAVGWCGTDIECGRTWARIVQSLCVFVGREEGMFVILLDFDDC